MLAVLVLGSVGVDVLDESFGVVVVGFWLLMVFVGESFMKGRKSESSIFWSFHEGVGLWSELVLSVVGGRLVLSLSLLPLPELEL